MSLNYIESVGNNQVLTGNDDDACKHPKRCDRHSLLHTTCRILVFFVTVSRNRVFHGNDSVKIRFLIMLEMIMHK